MLIPLFCVPAQIISMLLSQVYNQKGTLENCSLRSPTFHPVCLALFWSRFCYMYVAHCFQDTGNQSHLKFLISCTTHSYFYTGTVSLEKVKRNVCALLLAADELQLTDLISYLQQELIANHKNYVMDHLTE